MALAKRPLGKTGIEVSEIGLGAWQLGAHREWDGPGEDESIEIVREALRLGCTFIDTASPYADGRSEEYLGRALEGVREQAVICTKFGFWAPGYQPDHSASRIEEAVELSLRRLRTSYLDVLLFHGVPSEWGGTPQHWSVLQRLVDSGVLRAYGVSVGSGTAAQLREVVETTGSQVVEVHFSALRQSAAPAFAAAADAGVGLIANVPLEAGWLTGKYSGSAFRFPGESRNNRGWSPAYMQRMSELVAEFGALLPAGTPLAQGALAFVLSHPEVSTVIPGAKSVAQLRSNVAAAAASPLPPSAVSAIRALGARVADELG